MSRRSVGILLVCAAVVYACTPRNRVSADDTARPAANHAQGTTDTSGALALTLTEASDEDAMSFALEVKNTGKRSEVRFNSGKTHDFVVLDELNREVWRWSEGRLFTQSLQTKQLKTGDAVRYTATWDDAVPGNYRVVAELNSDTNPVSIERAFIVR
jgi:hypothetical protein